MYTFEQLMSPVWGTEVIYDEFLTMVRCNGVSEAPLLFEPEEVLSVTSADKTMEYEEGKDWEIEGNTFRLTKGSRIFAFEESDLVFEENKPDESFPTVDGKYSLFREGHFFHDRQISITYKKAEGCLGFAPKYSGTVLPKTMAKLHNKENVRIVLYGDSIAAGANSSGMTLTTPFLPRWGNLFAENLKRHYGTKVEIFNTSVGCKDSYWGMENAQTRAGDYAPDLAIIAFGMNDHARGVVFAENIKKIMEQIRQVSPKTEFILCATTVPNKRVQGFYFYQDEHLEALSKLQEEGVAIADFYTMQKCLMGRKRFIDMTGNNLNHPNDFLIRCHAQLLSAMLIEDIREIKCGDYTAKINLTRGANCFSLRNHKYGAKILREPDYTKELDNPYLYGMPILFPVNRISGGRFEFEGREYSFPINEPATGCHLHGELHRTAFVPWEISENKIVCSYKADESSSYLDFPHEFEIRITYELKEDGFYQTTEVINQSDYNMPVFLGFHTTFQALFTEDSEPQNIKVLAEISEEYERNMANYLPTGAKPEFDESSLALCAGEFSPFAKATSRHYRSGLSGRMVIYDAGKDLSVVYENDEKYKFRLIYNGNADEYICLEPQNCMANCQNSPFDREEAGFDYIEPGKSKLYVSKISIEKRDQR